MVQMVEKGTTLCPVNPSHRMPFWIAASAHSRGSPLPSPPAVTSSMPPFTFNRARD